jgi:hypothetical protein
VRRKGPAHGQSDRYKQGHHFLKGAPHTSNHTNGV